MGLEESNESRPEAQVDADAHEVASDPDLRKPPPEGPRGRAQVAQNLGV